MSRTVTALYDSRTDAEAARARLIAGARTESTRIIAKDTVAAVDTLFDGDAAKACREAIGNGSHLLVAEIEAGQDAEQVVALLGQGAGSEPAEAPEPEVPTYGFMGVTDEQPAATETAKEEPKVEAPAPVAVAPPPVEQAAAPRAEDELRIGMPHKARGGARVRSVVREEPAEEQVALGEEHVDVEHRASERRLSFDDVKAGGLLRERVFEIREMREEPVITKEAFVREEVIVRKTVRKRTETVRDTIRRTDVEVDDIGANDESRGVLFGGRTERRQGP